LLNLVEANAHRHLALGITAVQDAWAPPAFLALFRRAAEAGRLPLYYAPLRGSADGLFGSPAPWLDGEGLEGALPPRLRRGGVKFFADGAGATAAICDPTLGGLDEGLLFYDQVTLNTLVERAAHLHFTVAIHAIGNRGIAAALSAFAHARQAAPGSRSRLRIDHFFWAVDAHVERLRSLDAAVVTQPVGIWQTGDRRSYQERDPRFLLFPIAQLQAAGVPVAGSSDAPCFALPPLWGIAAAVERTTATGRPLAPEQAVAVEDAIRAYTLGSAWAGGTDDIEGSITPGKLANLAVLTEDPTAVPAARIRDIVVDETWLDGRAVYRRMKDEG
jgi:predicted amidohydrolase YtcJ